VKPFSWNTLREKCPAWRPLLAGIVNVTPDSFSDGGRFLAPDAAVRHALALLDEGADFLDLGGESTRPGAPEVPAEEEWRRIGPVLTGVLMERPETVFSIDTRHAATARKALAAGARVVNDVSGLIFEPEILSAAAERGAGLIVMHSPAPPEVMQNREFLSDADPVATVRDFLRRQTAVALARGIRREALMLDVGIGFGKTRAGNYELLRHAGALEREFGLPFFWGVSRKSMFRSEPDTPEKRLAASLAAAVLLAEQKVAALRVHDVAMTLAALAAAHEMGRSEGKWKA